MVSLKLAVQQHMKVNTSNFRLNAYGQRHQMRTIVHNLFEIADTHSVEETLLAVSHLCWTHLHYFNIFKTLKCIEKWGVRYKLLPFFLPSILTEENTLKRGKLHIYTYTCICIYVHIQDKFHLKMQSVIMTQFLFFFLIRWEVKVFTSMECEFC